MAIMRVISPGREGDPTGAVLARNDVMMMMIMFIIKMKMIMLELSFLELVLIDIDWS